MAKNGFQMTFWQFFLAIQFFHVIQIQNDLRLAIRSIHKTKLFRTILEIIQVPPGRPSCIRIYNQHNHHVDMIHLRNTYYILTWYSHTFIS
jgi:hypothetical protein